MYRRDWGEFPPGDATGSANLARCLGYQGPKIFAYFDFAPYQLHPGGVLNPLSPDALVHYRAPGIHNSDSFDLWTEDLSGDPEGINNWE